MRRRFLLEYLGLAAALAAARRAGAADVVQGQLRESLFQPATLTVKAGATVRWTNHEKRTSHSVLFTGEGGFESERMFPDESWERRFDKPGRYPYTCGPHPEMKGLVVVEP